MSPTLSALKVTPSLISRLAGYAKWLNLLYAGNPEWSSQDLQLTPQSQLLQFFNDQTSAEIMLFQVRQTGVDWEGNYDRDNNLCLFEGEARMIVDRLRGPRPKASRLYLEDYQTASYRPVTLAEVLASAEQSQRLANRLRDLTDYPAEVYERADAAVFWLERSTSFNLLFCDDQLIPLTEANSKPQSRLSWGNPFCVWNSDGLGGVMAVDGHFLIPCRFSYLEKNIAGGCVEASTQPLADVRPPLGHWDFLNFRCNIFDINSGRQVNPAATPALVNSLSIEGVFVALSDQHTATGRPLLGFMDTKGHWLGAPCWADVLLFNDGLAAVQCPDTGLWGFINLQGETVIAPQFIDGNFFNQGLNFVQKPSSPNDWYAINKQGAIVTGPWQAIDHRRNMLVVQDEQNRWALVDATGQIVLNPQTLPDGLEGDEHLMCLDEAYRTQRQALAHSLLDGVPLFLVRFRTFQKPLSMRVSRAWHLATRMDAGFSDPLQFLFSS